jgi:hypothetical protein
MSFLFLFFILFLPFLFILVFILYFSPFIFREYVPS